MLKPKLSVIVPCYGVEKYLDRCVSSLVGQSLHDIEIILVDDKSHDRVPQMCDEWVRRDARIKVIHKSENEGLGLARNSGLELAIGEYVAFVDSDDYVDLKMYEELYSYAMKNNLEVALCNCIFYKNEKKKVIRYDVCEDMMWIGREKVNEFLLDMVAPAPEYPHDVKYMMSVWHGIYKTSLIKENNICFVSERVYPSEDIHFNLDLYPYVERVGYIGDALYYYCYNGLSLSRCKYTREKYEKVKCSLKLVEEKLAGMFYTNDFALRFYRLKFLYLRSALKHSVANSGSDGDLAELLSDDFWSDVLNKYPYERMNIKHCFFFFVVKHKLIFILKYIFRFFM